MMDEKTLADIEARARAATSREHDVKTAQFMRIVREDIPALVSEVRDAQAARMTFEEEADRQGAEVKRLRDALRRIEMGEPNPRHIALMALKDKP